MTRHYRVNDYCAMHGIGRSKFYELVRAGQLRIVKLGVRKTLVPEQPLPTSLPTIQARIMPDNGGQRRTTRQATR